ncbi:AbrB/MazE/SpoVT family DNA-binding domain-containing protein [Nitrospirillum sp. BR 11164]|uniref:AbrB/MazE/SpoVT family DNA-binding domain-containing protein n=1 Tax=Nitrospirillum sp. BR 11164 TaxID=3104324 RepID=UPI002AFECEC8|nr:AbrB/MazE/SpoVT family DNA-binding domain-containing protein [Nitrospirillum sp. BR 11164]MEA1650973.1 AbrB/MazE/SpoVT family DNA-binding domain-containing protein [Nitrospirillum sp. BR 11164]
MTFKMLDWRQWPTARWRSVAREGAIRIVKWGNSLAIRLPVAMVKALGLKEGDEV